MNRSWYAVLVTLLWLVTTSWLFVAKILPTLLPGTPPGYQALYAANNRLIPVAWSVLWDEKPLGFATSQAHWLDGGGMRVESLLHLDQIPIREMLPAWTRLLIGGSLPARQRLSMEATGSLAIDAAGVLTHFRSTIDLPGVAERVFLEGTIDDGNVEIVVRAGEMRYQTTRYLPTNVTLGDELSPQATLPGLVAGRRWTVPVYSPLRPAQSPIEILHAEVSGTETLLWDDRLVTVDVVSYRDDPSSHREPRSRLWVDRTGRVLKQETSILGKSLAFVRRTDDQAAVLTASLIESNAGPSAALEGR